MNRNKILLAIALILNLFILACLQYFILVNHMLDNKIIYPGDFDSREFNFFIAWIWPVVLILWYKLKKMHKDKWGDVASKIIDFAIIPFSLLNAIAITFFCEIPCDLTSNLILKTLNPFHFIPMLLLLKGCISPVQSLICTMVSLFLWIW